MQVEVKDINIHYEIKGPENAPVVVCSHCLAGNLDIWEPQLDILRKDFRVLRFDTRGHGGTSAPGGAYSMELLASDVAGLLDVLEIDRIHFMGISLGGMIGQMLALLEPHRIASLILCDTTCMIPGEAAPIWDERIRTAEEQGMASLADANLDRWFSPEFRQNSPGTIERIRKIIVNTPVPGFIGCSHAIRNFNVKSQLPRLSIPALIMVGENDPGTPVESAEQIREQLSGSQLTVLPKAYHLSNIESAEAFNRGLVSFLREL